MDKNEVAPPSVDMAIETVADVAPWSLVMIFNCRTAMFDHDPENASEVNPAVATLFNNRQALPEAMAADAETLVMYAERAVLALALVRYGTSAAAIIAEADALDTKPDEFSFS